MPATEKLPKTHVFNGRKYKLKWCKPRNAYGICHPPDDPYESRRICVDPKLPREDFVETLIHEALHAEQWYLDEDTVERIAKNLTSLLRRCNALAA